MSIITMEVCLAALLALTAVGTGLSMVRTMKKPGLREPPLHGIAPGASPRKPGPRFTPSAAAAAPHSASQAG